MSKGDGREFFCVFLMLKRDERGFFFFYKFIGGLGLV